MTDPTADSRPSDDAHDLRQRERLRGDVRRVERALRHGAVALLLAIAALLVALFAGWRTIETGRRLEARLAAVPAADAPAPSASHADTATDAQARIDPLAARLDQLDARLGRAEARLEAPERGVARAEAAYLVELGSRRLALDRDVAGATVLFEAADQRLATRGDATALRIRAQLGHDIAALRAVAPPDLAAIGARLAAVESAVRDLPMLGAIRGQYVPSAPSAAPERGALRAWHQFTTSLQDLVSVRRVSDASVRLVSVEEIGVRRRHLQTLLFAARLAAQRADQAEYAADVAEASDWLARYFDSNDAHTRGVATELAALAASRVAVDLPDVSGSLRVLRAGPP